MEGLTYVHCILLTNGVNIDLLGTPYALRLIGTVKAVRSRTGSHRLL